MGAKCAVQTILLRRLSSTSSVLSLPSRTSLRSRPLLYAKSTLAFVALFPRTVITETRSGIVHTSHQSSHSFSEVELLKPHTSQTQHIEKQRQTRCISQSTPWCWPPLQLAKHMLHPSATSTRPSTATHASSPPSVLQAWVSTLPSPTDKPGWPRTVLTRPTCKQCRRRHRARLLGRCRLLDQCRPAYHHRIDRRWLFAHRVLRRRRIRRLHGYLRRHEARQWPSLEHMDGVHLWRLRCRRCQP